MTHPKTLFVEDLNCSAKLRTREHEMPNKDGTTSLYNMEYGQKAEVPFEHAVLFLRDPAFRVTNEEGQRLEPTPQTPVNGAGIKLAPDQVVARLDELTLGALSVRAAQIPGTTIPKTAKKGDLIRIITKHRTSPDVPYRVAEDEIEPDAEIMNALAEEIEHAPA